MTVRYIQGSDLPDLAVTWRDMTGALIDFSSGWTFELKLAPFGSQASVITKTSGITGAAIDPNVTIAWVTSGELNTLPPGDYHGQLRAQRDSDNKQRFRRFVLRVEPAIT